MMYRQKRCLGWIRRIYSWNLPDNERILLFKTMARIILLDLVCHELFGFIFWWHEELEVA